MIEFFDYSSRRGVLVPLLPKVHALLPENAKNDKTSGQEPPEHIITWQQKIRQQVVDINRRFLVAKEGEDLAGLLFYRFQGTDIYIEDLHVSWKHRNNIQVVEGLLKKLEFDQGAKDASFYASNRVKIEHDKEILADRAREERSDGWEALGSLGQTINALRIRYTRTS